MERTSSKALSGAPEGTVGNPVSAPAPEPAGGRCVREVPFRQIRMESGRFRYRLEGDAEALKESLEQHGQLTPVLLWGQQAPYAILDGHLRCLAMQVLGWPTVRAILRTDLSRAEAYAVTYLGNVQRRNLSTAERAHAVWQAITDGGLSRDEVMASFGLNEHQVERYLELMKVHPQLLKLVSSGDISMAHALVLREVGSREHENLVGAIRSQDLSAHTLRRMVRRQPRQPEGRQSCLRPDPGGFTLGALNYSQDAPRGQKLRLLADLEHALQLVRRDLGERTPSPPGSLPQPSEESPLSRHLRESPAAAPMEPEHERE